MREFQNPARRQLWRVAGGSGVARGALVAALGSALALAGTAHAAGANAADAAAADAAPVQGLGDIVVSASKRETDVQKTPLAVTALTADTLTANHVTDAVDLNGLVPSLVITTSEGFERNIAIRGVGFNVPQNDAAQPSVSQAGWRL